MWQCKKCGHVGDFILRGKGFARCSKCGVIHFVAVDGKELILLIREDDKVK